MYRDPARIETTTYLKTKYFTQFAGFDTAPAVGAGVRPEEHGATQPAEIIAT